MKKCPSLLIIIMISSIMQLQGAAEPSQEQLIQSYRNQVIAIADQAMLSPQDIEQAGNLLLQVKLLKDNKGVPGKAEGPLKKIFNRIMQEEAPSPEIIAAARDVLEKLNKKMPTITAELANLLPAPEIRAKQLIPQQPKPHLAPTAIEPKLLIEQLTGQINKNEQIITKLKEKLKDKAAILQERDELNAQRDQLRNVLEQPEPSKDPLQLLADALQHEDADIVLFSVGSRGYESQEVPYFIKNIARKFPDKVVHIYSISAEQSKQSSLSSRATNNRAHDPENQQFYTISKDDDPLERYRHPLLKNIEVISVLTRIPNKDVSRTANQFMSTFTSLIKQTLLHGKIFILGNSTGYFFNMIPDLAKTVYTYFNGPQIPNINNLIVYSLAGNGPLIIYHPKVLPGIPVYDDPKGKLFLADDQIGLQFAAFQQTEPITFQVDRINNHLYLQSITGTPLLPKHWRGILKDGYDQGFIKELR